jgi:hypothetical protein
MQVLSNLEKYINQTLGLEVDTAVWEDGARGFPFFLRNAYDFFLLHLMGRNYLLVVDLQREEMPAATIRKHMEQLRKVWPEELIYVREQMTGYNRNRLISNQVPFVVPGNQLYLPMLAIDLREHFIARREEVATLSPAAQVLVLHAIYNHKILFDQNMTLTAWAGELDYTKMTMTRAFRELRTILEGEEHLEELTGRRLWDRLRPYLRNPIRRRHYYHVNPDVPKEKGPILAGDSALAHYTPMAEPDHTVICMVGPRWNTFVANRNPIDLARPEPGCVEVEVWRYPPMKFARNGFADPLSVYLSFEKNTDERIEMALEEMLEDVPW